MLKTDEIAVPTSCLNRARDDERIFVLLGRDAAAPVAIRAWIAERLRLGKNAPDDAQIVGALDLADRMERDREEADAKRLVEAPGGTWIVEAGEESPCATEVSP